MRYTNKTIIISIIANTIELTVELAEEEGLTVDEAGFAKAMEEQKQKARENQNFSTKLNGGVKSDGSGQRTKG